MKNVTLVGVHIHLQQKKRKTN